MTKRMRRCCLITVFTALAIGIVANAKAQSWPPPLQIIPNHVLQNGLDTVQEIFPVDGRNASYQFDLDDDSIHHRCIIRKCTYTLSVSSIINPTTAEDSARNDVAFFGSTNSSESWVGRLRLSGNDVFVDANDPRAAIESIAFQYHHVTIFRNNGSSRTLTSPTPVYQLLGDGYYTDPSTHQQILRARFVFIQDFSPPDTLNNGDTLQLFNDLPNALNFTRQHVPKELISFTPVANVAKSCSAISDTMPGLLGHVALNPEVGNAITPRMRYDDGVSPEYFVLMMRSREYYCYDSTRFRDSALLNGRWYADNGSNLKIFATPLNDPSAMNEMWFSVDSFDSTKGVPASFSLRRNGFFGDLAHFAVRYANDSNGITLSNSAIEIWNGRNMLGTISDFNDPYGFHMWTVNNILNIGMGSVDIVSPTITSYRTATPVPRPQTVAKIFPQNATVFSSLDSLTHLSWNRIADATAKYHVQLATDTFFTYPILDTLVADTMLTQLDAAINALQSYNQVYWHVSAFKNREGLFGEPWMFMFNPTRVSEHSHSQPATSLITVSPNPFGAATTIHCDAPNGNPLSSLVVYDILGREVARYAIALHGDFTVDANTWPMGVYWASLAQAGTFVGAPLMHVVR